MRQALRGHWPEYPMEAGQLGLFMLSACVFATLLYYPGSPLGQGVEHPLLRRLLMGSAMALTAMARDPDRHAVRVIGPEGPR